MSGKQRPDIYREMVVPFESLDKANEAITGFFDELYEIRKKYKLPDVAVVISATAKEDDGSEQTFMTLSHIGDERNQEPLLAYAFGKAQQLRKELVGRLLSGRGTVEKGK